MGQNGLTLTDSAATFHQDMAGALCWMTSGNNAGLAREIGGRAATGPYPTLQIADTEFQTRAADLGLTHTLAISTVEDLQDINNNLAGNYYLTQDIDASGFEFTPLGYSSDVYNNPAFPPFTGTLDGCGYTIRNLTIADATNTEVALFKTIFGGAKIANLTFETCSMGGKQIVSILACTVETAPSSLAFPFGAPPGWYTGNAPVYIRNVHFNDCTITESALVSTPSCGFLAGFVYGSYTNGGDDQDPNDWQQVFIDDCTVIDCSYDWGQYPPARFGGLAGEVTAYTVINNCRVWGLDLDGTDEWGASDTGGFIGYLYGDAPVSGTHSVTITDCSVHDLAINADSNYVGGFIGYDDSSGASITRCSARGDIEMGDISWYGGGFIGEINSTVITDCYTWVNFTSKYTVASENPPNVGGFTTLLAEVGNSGTETIVTNTYVAGVITISEPTGAQPYDVEDLCSGYSSSGAETTCVLTSGTNFWDTETTGFSLWTPTSVGSSYRPAVVPDGHTTSWLKTQSNYEAAGWDFDTVWEMDGAYVSADITDTTITFVEPFPYEIESGDTYCISGVPFKARCWKLQATDVDRFNRWNMVGTMLKCRKLSGFDGNVNNKWRVSVHRGAKADLENISSYVLVDSNPSDSAGAINVDGVDLEPYIEQISAGTKFELTDAEFNVSWTDSRKVGI